VGIGGGVNEDWETSNFLHHCANFGKTVSASDGIVRHGLCWIWSTDSRGI